MNFPAPGSYHPPNDQWTDVHALGSLLPSGSLVIIDARVAKLHPLLLRALETSHPLTVLQIPGGERAKSLHALQRVIAAGARLPRRGTLVAVGGGTIGDLGTVAAHLLKRGVSLVHVPTTLLAAVDSTIGGKGALNLRTNRHVIKNILGVFHYPCQTILCPELFATLTPAQRREGTIEAWKMAVCLDEHLWHRWCQHPPDLRTLICTARALKESVCRRDPYETLGIREVLNFGHTFGHVFESLSKFRLSHGDAVGLGMLCALDTGIAMGVTPVDIARKVEHSLRTHANVPDRQRLARLLRNVRTSAVASILAADKKNKTTGPEGQVRMVLLQRPGAWVVRDIPDSVWHATLSKWRAGTSVTDPT